MEIPEISMIGDFEAGMKCLQNPTLISRFFSLSGIAEISHVYGFWKWGALIIALVATFSGVINGVKLLIVRVCTVKSSAASSQSFLGQDNDYSDLSGDDASSSLASDDEEYSSTSPSGFEDQDPVDEDFRVAGSSCFSEFQGQNGRLRLRRCHGGDGSDRFSWSNLAMGKSVVKLWDSLALGLDFEDFSGNVVSLWDLNKDKKISSFFTGTRQIPAAVKPTSSVFSSANVNDGDGVVVSAFDMRMTPQIPAIYAEWLPQQSRVVDVTFGGVEKVYLRDCITGDLTVADMRNAKMPLKDVTESDGDTWWDADAVIVEKEYVE